MFNVIFSAQWILGRVFHGIKWKLQNLSLVTISLILIHWWFGISGFAQERDLIR